MNPKISVIIAVYKSEKFIKRCVISLFNQTLDNIEFIFIDDCSPDDSIKIVNNVLKEYPSRKKQTKIIKMPFNSKQAAVRTRGILEATGEYIIHCDPDDWIENNMYEMLYETAKKEEADIVTCAIGTHKINSLYDTKIEIFQRGVDALLEQKISHSLVNKIIKRSIFIEHNIFPFENINYGEDCNTVIRAVYFSGKVVKINKELYHYDRSNENAITKTDIIKLLNQYSIPNLKKLDDFFQDKEKKFKVVMSSIKYETKSPLLLTAFHDGCQWYNFFPECHKHILKFKNLPISFRIAMRIACLNKNLIKIISRYLNRNISIS